jgi:hypothetical protein
MVGGIVIARKTGSPQQDAALADAALANSALANSALANSALAISAVANPDGAAASTVTGQSNSTEATHG